MFINGDLMKLPLAYYGSPSLRMKAKPIETITDEIRQLAADLLETMHAANGIGLAATQVNKNVAMFATFVPIYGEDQQWHDGQERIFINPKIVWHSEEQFLWNDGCLSIPGLHCEVYRPQKIRIQALDLEGNPIEEEMENLFAFNFMHENDHLNGVLFIDRLDKETKKQIQPTLTRIKREYS